MVKVSKKNFSPPLVGKNSKSTLRSTRRRHQANEGMSSLDADWIRSLRTLHITRSKKNLAAEKWHPMHLLSIKETEKWIDDYVDRETAVPRQRVEDTEMGIMHEQEDMTNAKKAGLTTRKPEKTFEEMLIAIRVSLSCLASSDTEEDLEDQEDIGEHPELGKLSNHHEPGWVMGSIFQTAHHHNETIRLKQVRIEELTQLGWGDAADCLRVRHMRYGSADLKVPAVVKPQIDKSSVTPPPTTFGQLKEMPDVLLGKLQTQQRTSRPGSCCMRYGSGKAQSHKHEESLLPIMAPDSSTFKKSKPVQPFSFEFFI